jgi:polar amino acid transport system substrate-binding protein
MLNLLRSDFAGAGLRCLVAAFLSAVSVAWAQAPATAPVPANAPPELRGAETFPAKPRARAAAPVLDAIRAAGVLRVGVVSIPPWTMPAASGELIGFEIDVGTQLARDLGVRVEFVRTSLRSYAGDLADGRFDVAAAGIWPDPASALLVNFSRPYAANTIDLLAPGSKPGSRSVQEFNRSVVTIGVRKGSHSEATARRDFPNARIITYDSDEPMFSALLGGKVSAVVAASPVVDFLQAANPKRLVKPLAEPLLTRREALAVVRGDPDLLAYLDTWLRYQEETGWLPERRNYWFRSFEWAAKL